MSVSPSNRTLGRLLSEHRADRDRLIAMTVVVVLLGSFFLTLLLMVLLRPAPSHVKAVGSLFFGGFVGLFAGATVHYARRFWWRIELYEGGLAFVQRSSTELTDGTRSNMSIRSFASRRCLVSCSIRKRPAPSLIGGLES